MKHKSLSVFYGARIFLVSSFVFLGLSVLDVWAQGYEDLYGPELKSVSYAYRVKFANENNKPWSEATYDERYNFIVDMEKKEQAEEIAKQKEDIAEESLKARKAQAIEAKKLEEIKKAYNKQRLIDDAKMQEERKKYEYTKKSIAQRQKMEKMRYQQR